MMNCPSCKNPFAFESDGKFHCDTCGWFENVGDPNPEWHTCEAPEPATPPEPKPPDPEPGPDPGPQVREYLGGVLTVTEVDE